MEYAIIAAGEGSRLKQGGFKSSKPMVQLHGVTLIERLINIFSRNNAEKIYIIINEYSQDLEQHLDVLRLSYPIEVLRKTTPSSLHSFHALLPLISGGSICLTTVDTIFNEAEFEAYIHFFQQNDELDGLMAATSFVDDEKPLYLATVNDNVVTGFFDNKTPDCELVSGGIYCLKKTVFPIVTKAVSEGVSRMRNFQRMLIEERKYIKAFPFSKIIDIDHVSDIEKAELFLHKPAMAE